MTYALPINVSEENWRKSVSSWLGGQAINVMSYPFNARGDGSTDDTAAIQGAITAAALTGGYVAFPPGTYMVSSLTLVSYVKLVNLGGATIRKITGGATTMFASATTGVLYEAGLIGLDIDATDALTVLDLNSPYDCALRDLRIAGTATTSVVLDIGVNTAGDTNPDGNRNAVFNDFQNLLQDGTCGTFIKLEGVGVGAVPIAVVTLNTFSQLNARDCRVRGIDFAQWCDSNHFNGITRLQINAVNAVGVEHNTAAPTANRGVYANNFDSLAIDTFGVYAGRVAVKMNLTKNNKIGMMENDPIAEGGDFVADAVNTLSYDVVLQKGGTNDLWHLTRGYYNNGSIDNYLGTTTGAADVMVATPSPALTSYNTGPMYVVKSGFTNATTTPTINVSGLGAKTIVKRAATALAAGDYVANMMMILVYDGTNMELLNPVVN